MNGRFIKIIVEGNDKPSTLFYLDPPYWKCEKDYGKDVFARSDFEALVKQLKKIKGRFILSINGVPEIRALFKRADIEDVETTYTVGKGNGKKARELIISND